MKFGLDLLTGDRMEPKHGQRAICLCCKLPLIPKCGKIKVHHWAHKNDINCDQWWEPETEWHRHWKNRFPSSWQEVIKFDGEANKHIADVFNPKIDLVIEFQNSAISVDDIQAREIFYKRMIWVVNANRFDIEINGLDDYSQYNIARLKKEVTQKIEATVLTFRQEIKDTLNSLNDLRKEGAAEKIERVKELEKLRQSSIGEIENIKNSFKLSHFEKHIDNFIYYVTENEGVNHLTKYIQYSWKHRSKVWSVANQPVFLDLGERLILIKNNFIAMNVDKEAFIKKYGISEASGNRRIDSI